MSSLPSSSAAFLLLSHSLPNLTRSSSCFLPNSSSCLNQYLLLAVPAAPLLPCSSALSGPAPRLFFICPAAPPHTPGFWPSAAPSSSAPCCVATTLHQALQVWPVRLRQRPLQHTPQTQLAHDYIRQLQAEQREGGSGRIKFGVGLGGVYIIGMEGVGAVSLMATLMGRGSLDIPLVL